MENNQDMPVTDVASATSLDMPQGPPIQYLLMVDEISMIMMAKLFNGLQFLRVEGMPIKENTGVMVMVTPIPQAPEATEAAQDDNAPSSQLEAPQNA